MFSFAHAVVRREALDRRGGVRGPARDVAMAKASAATVSAVISRGELGQVALNCVKTQHLPSALAVVTTAKPFETAPSSEQPPA